MDGVQELSYKTWSEFKARFMSDIYGDGVFRRDRFLFRGQGSATFALRPSFDRYFETIAATEKNNIANSLIQEFKNEIERGGWLRESPPTDEEWIALAQHYGVPTRLLDWSDSPYIGAFFAFSDAIEHLVERDNIALWVLDRANTDVWSKESGVEIVIVSQARNLRLRNQEGKFTLSRTPFRSLEEYVDHFRLTEPVLFKMSIPIAESEQALCDLDAMGIRHSALFAEISGAARTAQLRVTLSMRRSRGASSQTRMR